MNTKTIFCALAILLSLAACKRDNQDTPPKPQDVNETVSSVLSQKPIDPTAPQSPQETVSHNGWVEIKPLQGETITRCLDIHGCEFKDKKYLAGSVIRNDQVFCGDKPAFEYVEQYYCEPTFGAMRCMDDKCDCGTTQGYDQPIRGNLCIDGAKYAISNAFEHELYPPLNAVGEIDDNDTDDDDFNDDDDDTDDDDFDDDDDDFNNDNDDEACERLEVENSCEKKFDPFKKIYGSSFACVDVLEQLEEDCGMVGTQNAFIYCDDKKGCKTSDGRIYRYKMHDPIRNVSDNILFDTDEDSLCSYHLEGDKDTTLETLCKTGDCVWPENYDYDLTISKQIILLNEKKASSDLPNEYKLLDEDVNSYTLPLDVDAYNVNIALPDTQNCTGGKRYCHGTKNAPILVPDSSDSSGYECRNTSKDSHEIKEWVCTFQGCSCGDTICPKYSVCTNGVCTCDGIILTENENYDCTKDQRYNTAAVCKADHCTCGNSTCIKGAMCHEGSCYCGTLSDINNKLTVDPNVDWICSSDQIVCNSEDGCPVSKQLTCPWNTIYHKDKNKCLCGSYEQPSKDFKCTFDKNTNTYDWICNNEMGCGSFYSFNYKEGDVFSIPDCWSEDALTDKGCMCGKELFPKNALCLESTKYGRVNVCNNTKCQYGQSTCVRGQYMINGECITPDSMDGKAAEEYWVEKAFQRAKSAVYCDEEMSSCRCGKTECDWGEWCIENECTYGTVVIDRFGKRFNYHFEPDEFNLDLSTDEDEAKRVIRRMLYGDWAGCYSGLSNDPALIRRHVKAWNLTSGEGDDISTYYCSFSHDCVFDEVKYGDRYLDAVGNVIPYGLYCLEGETDPENCRCGNNICASGNNNCICTTIDGKLKCGCETIDSYDASWPGERVCAQTIVETGQVEHYKCIAGLGFVCTEETCPCGDIQCAKNAVCVKPGICTPSAVYKGKW